MPSISSQSTNAFPDSDDDSACAVVIEDLGKRYSIACENQSRFLSNTLGKFYSAARSSEFWALRHINLKIKKGIFLGIAGPNGSGKSTLLKILAGIITPTSGRFQVKGRVAGMMELGVGFHPDLTGWENVFLYGAVLGLPRRLIRDRMKLIANCAGFDARFLNMPLKYYSSGMWARLGFAVAINADPDVLLIDEALAVGDGEYQNFSFQRIMEMRRAGKTIILVTHDLYSASDVCDEMVWLKKGELMSHGRPDEIVAAHQRDMTDRSLKNILLEKGPLPDGKAIKVLRAEARRLNDANAPLKAGLNGRITLDLLPALNIRDLRFMACILRSDGLAAMEIHSRDIDFTGRLESDRPIRLNLHLEPVAFRDGIYSLGIAFYEGDDERPVAWLPEALTFSVEADPLIEKRLIAHTPCQWRIAST